MLRQIASSCNFQITLKYDSIPVCLVFVIEKDLTCFIRFLTPLKTLVSRLTRKLLLGCHKYFSDQTQLQNSIRIIAVNRLVLSLSYEGNTRDNLEYRLRSGLEPPTFASNSVLGNFGGLVRSLPDILDELDINKSKEEQERSSNGELLDSETQNH